MFPWHHMKLRSRGCWSKLDFGSQCGELRCVCGSDSGQDSCRRRDWSAPAAPRWEQGAASPLRSHIRGSMGVLVSAKSPNPGSAPALEPLAAAKVFGWWLQLCVNTGSGLFPMEHPQRGRTPGWVMVGMGPRGTAHVLLCASSVQEFMTFTSQLIVERSELGSRASVKEQEYLCHVYVRNDGLAGVVIADNEYPPRVCFTLLDKVLDEFSRQVSRADWPSGSPATISYAALDGYLSKYQNPRDADPMTKVQAELDETKIILHNTMESLLERGEKLDDLVSKSEVLGAQSKAFYKTARKQNSCCAIM
uniref:YKT6 v-SNARE homolog n=1 Tax=Strigops habroptila TaxID=2489341 RepID=A0A672UK30_STRHB